MARKISDLRSAEEKFRALLNKRDDINAQAAAFRSERDGLNAKKREAQEKVREERDSGAVGQALDRLRIAAQSTENTMPYIIDAVRTYATLQEMMDVFREVFGLYREPMIL